MRSRAQISSLNARIQSSEFAVGLGGRGKQRESRIQSFLTSLKEFGDERITIQNSESIAEVKGTRRGEESRVQNVDKGVRDFAEKRREFRIQSSKGLVSETERAELAMRGDCRIIYDCEIVHHSG